MLIRKNMTFKNTDTLWNCYTIPTKGDRNDSDFSVKKDDFMLDHFIMCIVRVGHA